MQKILSKNNNIYRMMMMGNKYNFSAQYDLCVIGGGPGGYVAAIKGGQLGLKTVCIEKRGSLGGTCLNVGCIPSKALLNISHKYEEANKHFKEMGIEVSNVSYDWDKVQEKKGKIVTSLTKGIEGLFKKNKVDYKVGWGVFEKKGEVNVLKENGEVETISAKNFIIATGSEPSPFPGLAFDEKVIVSSTGALSLQKVPERLVVIGGGVIGLEMGSVYARLGSKVTVIEYQDGITPGIDLEIAKTFQKILTKQGINIMTSQKVVSGVKTEKGVDILIESVKDQKQQTIQGDVILVSTGRKPYTERLGLEKIGVQMDNRGRVEIDDHFKTNISGVFAIGDVVKGPMLAHKAEEEGIACVEQIVKGHSHINYNTIPGVIYTHPEVAVVGQTEEQLKAAQVSYNKGVFPFIANSRAKANDDQEGMVKILSDKNTDRILGIHIIGPNAGEMIAEGVLGMEYGASSEDIARTCHAHPTLSEAFKEACMGVYDKPIHM